MAIQYTGGNPNAKITTGYSMTRREFLTAVGVGAGLPAVAHPASFRLPANVIATGRPTREGRIYTAKGWELNRPTFAYFELDHLDHNRPLLSHVAAEVKLTKVEDHGTMGFIVTAVPRILPTPAGQCLASLLEQKVPIYMTPAGDGMITRGQTPGTYQVVDYQLTHFLISDGSSFHDATPIE